MCFWKNFETYSEGLQTSMRNLYGSKRLSPDQNPSKFGHMHWNETLNGRAAVAGPSFFKVDGGGLFLAARGNRTINTLTYFV